MKACVLRCWSTLSTGWMADVVSSDKVVDFFTDIAGLVGNAFHGSGNQDLRECAGDVPRANQGFLDHLVTQKFADDLIVERVDQVVLANRVFYL